MHLTRNELLRFVDLPGRRSADPFAGDGLPVSVRVVHIAPDTPRSAHRHPRSSETMYVASGRGRAWQDGVVTDLASGDLIHIPAGVPHATSAVGGPLVLVCFFPDPDLGANLEELDGVVLP